MLGFEDTLTNLKSPPRWSVVEQYFINDLWFFKHVIDDIANKMAYQIPA